MGHDVRHLADEQYRTTANLDARIRLHARYSTNPCPWQRWVFERLALPPTGRVLDLGCGTGQLWRENRDRIPPGLTLVLGDLSAAMLTTACAGLAAAPFTVHAARLDAQAVPCAAGTFDVVVANHMLYHVQDRAAALAEVRRVLRPGGRLLAATNGARHMLELWDLVERYRPAWAAVRPSFVEPFALENGEAQLRAVFESVVLHRHGDALAVSRVEDLVDYVRSVVGFGESERPAFAAFVERDLARQGGVLRIRKESGLFEARRA